MALDFRLNLRLSGTVTTDTVSQPKPEIISMRCRSRALNISTNELLGVKAIKQQRDPQHAALWRRLKKIETLPKQDQKALLHYLDALVKKNGGSKIRG